MSEQHNSFTYDEAYEESFKYFNDSLATTAFLNKYALRKIDKDGNVEFLEKSPLEMQRRVATAIFEIEKKYINPLEYEEIYNLIKDFKYFVPGGSVMYGAANQYNKSSLSNCVVINSPEDSISGIIDSAKDMANLFKYRAGVGISLDTLRPDGSPVDNAANTSTGAWSFAELYSSICKQIGQSGRRGALMLTMNVSHPDIEKFVTMKKDLNKVTGANISVMITDDFMDAVKKDNEWLLKWPINATGDAIKFQKIINAKELWNTICKTAVETAEPGVLFWDTYNRGLPANEYTEFKSICVNPCSEIALSSHDACRLGSLNLKSFVKEAFSSNAYFDYNFFKEIVIKSIRLMDDIIDMEIDRIQQIIDKSDDESEILLWKKLQKAATDGRRIGLGTHGLADALSCLLLKYDTPKAIEEVDKIYKTLRDVSYQSSSDLAKERGSFLVFNWDVEKNNDFIKRLPKSIRDNIEKNGRRNISILTNAPTGTIALVSQTSSGIEPVFMNSYTRRMKLNHDENIKNADFIDEQGDAWNEFFVLHKNIQDFFNIREDKKKELDKIQKDFSISEWDSKIKDVLPQYFITSHDIDAFMRIDIQSVCQKYICHGISSTINLPKGTTVEQGQQIYQYAYEKGLKGVTIYVDGSRSGVLIKNEKNNSIIQSNAPKRPKELPCDIHYSQIDNKKWTIFVGLMDGDPYEIFGGLSEFVTIPSKYKQGKIVKNKNGKKNSNGRYSFYDLYLGDDDDPLIINNIAVTFQNGNYAAQTRAISLMLRHGIPINFIAEQLGREENTDFFSFNKVMARVLKKYIVDGTESGDICEQCGAKLVFESGCYICKNCSYSPKCT